MRIPPAFQPQSDVPQQFYHAGWISIMRAGSNSIETATRGRQQVFPESAIPNSPPSLPVLILRFPALTLALVEVGGL
jgi:hypothetical protein